VLLLQRGQLTYDGPAPADGDQLRDLYRAQTAAPGAPNRIVRA
jgi:hypothetical protein